MFVDLDRPLNASSLLSASAELLVVGAIDLTGVERGVIVAGCRCDRSDRYRERCGCCWL